MDPLANAGIIVEFTDRTRNRAWRARPRFGNALDAFAARAEHEFIHDAGPCRDSAATRQPGRSERGGERPELFGRVSARPGQRAQHHICGTRIQIPLKLTPD